MKLHYNAKHECPARFARATVLGLLAGVVLGLSSPAVWAQEKKSAKEEEKTSEDVTLDTKDGVFLRCTYYPGPEKKTTVPLILLHDWDGNRGELHGLATFLNQTLNHSVIVPDLRGHGVSLRQRGVDAEIDREKLSRPAVEGMMWDVEAAKSYLLQRNNEGKLNIEQLCVVGTGFGATLALNWAVHDWNVPNLPTYKMGQDVKGLILISPQYQGRKGVNAGRALKDTRTLSLLSALIIVGAEEPRRLADAKRIFNAFEKAHSTDERGAVGFYQAATSLQGPPLVYARGLGASDWIAGFIDQRLIQRANLFTWTDRTSPLK